ATSYSHTHTLSLHDALPIAPSGSFRGVAAPAPPRFTAGRVGPALSCEPDRSHDSTLLGVIRSSSPGGTPGAGTLWPATSVCVWFPASTPPPATPAAPPPAPTGSSGLSASNSCCATARLLASVIAY